MFDRNGETSVRGRVIYPGIAFGQAFLESPLNVPLDAGVLGDGGAADEIHKLSSAIDLVRDHLEVHVREQHAPAEEDVHSILAAHLTMLDDHVFLGSIEDRIEQRRAPALRAVRDCFASSMERLSASSDEYMRARVEDLRDLCQNIQRAILFGAAAFESPSPLSGDSVYVSCDLRLSSVLRARRMKAVGFVTGSAAFTSHGAILLRASGIPSLGGVPLSTLAIALGDPLLIDADQGELIVRPSPRHRDTILSRGAAVGTELEGGDRTPLEATLTGGERVRLFANIDHPSQTDLCGRYRLSGVGLLRTEFLALERGRVPDEDEQYALYRTAVTNLAGRSLVIRTFDFGADKEPNGLNECTGRNPALGVRGIRRHLLRRPTELRQQLRAILRAAVGGDVSILLPVVTNIHDIRSTRDHLERVLRDLERAHTPHNPSVKLGAMIETPSAALQIDRILDEVDFVSVGTNDLLQYLTASDRDNPDVLDYLRPETSGLYRLLELVVETARSKGRVGDLCVCGQLASEPEGAAALAKIGIRCLSIVPAAAKNVRSALSPNGQGHEPRSSDND